MAADAFLPLTDVATDLVALVHAQGQRLRRIGESAAARRPAPGQWSRKEILGHLIDSAANNHQRFVRLQLQGSLELPGYEQDGWVRVSHYQDRPWADLVAFWETYNRNLAEIVRRLDPACLRHTWRDPKGQVLDLEFIVRDYVVHMRHHLDQIAAFDAPPSPKS